MNTVKHMPPEGPDSAVAIDGPLLTRSSQPLNETRMTSGA